MENNSTPWQIPLETRKCEAEAALGNGKKLAIILYSDVDLSSSFRYRAYNIYQQTKKSDKWQLIYFFENELESVREFLSETTIFIFGRIPKWKPCYDELALEAKSLGIKIVYDLDDCVCGTRYVKNMFNVVSPDTIDQDYWIATSANFELFSYLVDGFIVTNDYLGEILSKSHDNKPYRVIKNFLNEEQVEYSNNLLDNFGKINPQNFTIGYFSGSHTHATDFEVVYPELLQLLRDYPDIHLRIVGMLKLPDSAKEYLESGQIEYEEMVDFLTLEKLISEVDVNIAPLADNVFANCKSELKFFEASLVNVPTAASPSFSFKKAIKNKKTGFLCQPGEWYNTIFELYRSEKLCQEIAKAAHEYCIKNYTGNTCLKQIEETYNFYGTR